MFSEHQTWTKDYTAFQSGIDEFIRNSLEAKTKQHKKYVYECSLFVIPAEQEQHLKKLVVL